MRAGADFHLHLDPWYENDNVVPYLPPAWMTEQWFGIGCHLLSGCILNFAEAPETQQRDTGKQDRASYSMGLGYGRARQLMVQARILGADAIQRFAFRLLMPIGYKAADLKFQKKNQACSQEYSMPWRMSSYFRPIRSSLGLSNARICYTTGAVLSPDAFRFYHALNLPLKSLYGTTEGGALTGAKDDDIRLETVGPVHEGTEVKITDNGELIYRQPGIFVGYYKDPEKTAEVLKDGWFCSGDSCFIREDGHVVFVDRVEDLVELQVAINWPPNLSRAG